jgi:hypothetical protein
LAIMAMKVGALSWCLGRWAQRTSIPESLFCKRKSGKSDFRVNAKF